MNFTKAIKVKIFIEEKPEVLEGAINAFIQEHLLKLKTPGFKVVSLAIAFQWSASLIYEIYEKVPDEGQTAPDSTHQE